MNKSAENFCVRALFLFCKYQVIRLFGHAAATAKSLQSCLTLCDPTDGSPPGSPVPGILQARTLEWVSISFSNAWKWKVKVKSLSSVWLLATPWITAYQAPPSMGFSRQEYWSGVPLPSPAWSYGKFNFIRKCATIFFPKIVLFSHSPVFSMVLTSVLRHGQLRIRIIV